MTEVDRVLEKRRLSENASLHRQGGENAPFFTLTAEGAKALSAFLEKKQVKFSRFGGPTSLEVGVDTDVLRDFLAETLGLKVSNTRNLGTDTAAISQLLGVATRGHRVIEDDDMVALDPDALKILTRQKERR